MDPKISKAVDMMGTLRKLSRVHAALCSQLIWTAQADER